MSQYLDLIKEVLLKVEEKPNIIKKTLVFIELYNKGRVSKEKLIQRFKTCLVKCVEHNIFGSYPSHDKNNPCWLLEGLIFEFEKENASLSKKEKINPENMKVVRLNSSNFKGYLDYLNEGENVFGEMEGEGEEEIIRFMSLPNSFGILVFVNSQFAGDALGHCPPSEDARELELEDVSYNPKLIYLDTIVVSPNFQGKGIGGFLLKSFVEEAKRRGYTILEGHFRREVSGSYHLIKKFGAKLLTTKRDWMGSGEEYMYCRIRI